MKPVKLLFKPGVTVNDIGFRVILIPSIGIVIGWATGLVRPELLNLTQIKLAYLYCILISFVIWTGNWYILIFLRSYLDWFDQPLKKLVAIALTIPAYTLPVSVLMLSLFFQIFHLPKNDQVIRLTTICILIAVAFITHIYETAYTVKEVELEKLNKANSEKALAISELNALKTQLDPHFMMNSLNTLAYLIEKDQEKAGLFNQNLADIFRYMLQSKERDLVMLSDENKLLKKYLHLLSIRFEDALIFRAHFDNQSEDDYLIPSFSLQLLAENAIKHNIFTKHDPLYMDIKLEENHLIFSNSISKKDNRAKSTGIGLENLNARCKLLTGKPIQVVHNFEIFEVRVPLLKS